MVIIFVGQPVMDRHGGGASSDGGFYICVTDTGFWSVKQGPNPVARTENNIPGVSVL